jgi:hypothetical protein
VRIDLLLTSFAAHATPGEAATERGIGRMACQIDVFRPRLVVPVASFAHFSRIDNTWRNHGRPTPLDMLDAPVLAALRGVVRFMRPGAQFELASATPAALCAQHAEALAYWMARWRVQPAPLPRPSQATLAELKEAFAIYRDRVGVHLHGLPRMLEWLGILRPLHLALPDLHRTIVLSYRHGLRPLARDARADIAMCSGTALYLLRDGDGFDTTVAGGCFRACVRKVCRCSGVSSCPSVVASVCWGGNGHGILALRCCVRHWFGHGVQYVHHCRECTA